MDNTNQIGHFSIADIESPVSLEDRTTRTVRPLRRTTVPHSDVVIVGAGMSGLYVAWRLLQENKDRQVVVVDKIDRTGGRLDSDVITTPGGYEVKEEEGGMRFTFDLMENLMSLLLLFDLVPDIVPFPMSSGGSNRLYFRASSFNNTEAKQDNYKKWAELYTLLPDKQGIDPSGVPESIFKIICEDKENKGLSGYPSPEERTPEFWQKFRLKYKWKRVLLKDWNLWNLCSAMNYSNEFTTLLYRISGFNGTYLSNMSAGEAFQLLLDFPSNPEFMTLKKGFSTLPNAMVRAIGKERIWLNTLVKGIDRCDNGKLRVHYTRKTVDNHVVTNYVEASNVVLALPRLALEKLFVSSSVFRTLPEDIMKTLWNTILTTTNQALVKINLYYKKAWWGTTSNPPVDFGPNFSDLPLGSVYPFYEIDDTLFAALEYENWYKENGQQIPADMIPKLEAISRGKFDKPAALTIYCDFLNVEYWKALQTNGPPFDSPLQQEYDGKMYAASRRVVAEATKFFKLLFNTDDVPSPILTSARIWSGTTEFFVPPQEQVGYGVHQWALQAEDDVTMDRLAQPIDGLTLFTCGEAYSDYQGWVEGALRSANLVLARPTFGLKPISDVYKQQYGESATEAITKAYSAASEANIRRYIDSNFPPSSSSF